MKTARRPRARIPGEEVDYWHKLSPEDRRWLQKFNDERVNDYFRKGELPVHRGKRRRKEVRDSRYRRRSDAFGMASPTALSELHGRTEDPTKHLETTIKLLDLKKKKAA